jgi:hypothetical protein
VVISLSQVRYITPAVDATLSNKIRTDQLIRIEFLTAESMKMAVSWVVASCSLGKFYRRFRGFTAIVLMMETSNTSETSVKDEPSAKSHKNITDGTMYRTSRNVANEAFSNILLKNWEAERSYSSAAVLGTKGLSGYLRNT